MLRGKYAVCMRISAQRSRPPVPALRCAAAATRWMCFQAAWNWVGVPSTWFAVVFASCSKATYTAAMLWATASRSAWVSQARICLSWCPAATDA